MRLFSLFLLLGTLLIQWFDVLPSWKIWIIPLLISIGLGFSLKNKYLLYRSLCFVSLAFFLGLLLASYQATRILENRISPEWEGKELLVTGKIINIPSVRDDGVRFLLDIHSAKPVDDSSISVDGSSLSFDDSSINTSKSLKGIVRLGWFKSAKVIQSGELWQLKVKLKRPSGFMNPGGFDYEKWLFTQRIIATGYVRQSKNDNDVINQKLKPTLVFKSVDHWRQTIHSFIQKNVENQSSAAVLSALLVAVRDKLDDKQWQLLQATGTSHLIAISGLHIAVVAGFAFFPMMLFWRLFPRLNERIPLRIAGACVGTLFALAYAMLAGFTLPTQRALLMVMIGLWGLVSRRNYDSIMILSLALILVLIWDPLAAMSISFWLSFLAVFLIVLFMQRQKERPAWLVIKLQLFLSLAMLPLTLLFFGAASFTSPIANLFAIPWVSLVIVPISLLALVAMPFSTLISTKLLSIAAYTVDLLFKGLELVSSSVLSTMKFAEIPASLLMIAFVGLLVLILPRGFPARWLGVLLILPVVFHQGAKLENNEFTYTLLDVGQGYASVLKTQNHTLVYDTGTRVSDSFDLGKLVVAPYLDSEGIKKIDTLMISHEDIDHRGGAKHLIDNYEIEDILSSDTQVLTSSKACISGQKWQWDGVNFEVLSPTIDLIDNDNNRSCVLKAWNQYHSLLLTGDIQKRTEKALLKSHAKQLKSEVISVPHHGSKTSSSLAFLKHVSPQIGLISAGYRSRFGHPKPTIVKRYQDAGVELLDTVNYGAISLRFPANANDISREYYRIESKGIWSR